MTIKITVTDRNNQDHELEVEEYNTLARAIRENLSPDSFMICGGCCACATCHVEVDPEWTGKLKTIDDDEDAMLDSVDRTDNSRLSCQVELTEEHNGLKVKIA
jgi:2Fe-2S ferredoxin